MNLALLLESSAAACPDRAVLTGPAGTIDYRTLEERSRAFGAWLVAEAPHGPLSYLGPNSPAMVEAFLGCAYAGRPFSPLNYRVKEAEVAGYLRCVEPTVLLADARNLDKARAAARTLAHPPRLLDLAEVTPAPGVIEAPMDQSAPAVYLFTSGTTSEPKAAIITHRNLFEYVLDTAEAASATAEEAMLIVTPPYHVATTAQVLSNLFRCRRMVFMAQFDGRAWLELVGAERITHAMVVPTMLSRILDALEQTPELVPDTLVSLSYGGSKAPAGLVERALHLLPERVGLVNAFGLTECSSTVTVLSADDHRRAWAATEAGERARLNSVGRLVPGIELRIADGDGMWAPPGVTGEICLRGVHVSAGYVGGASDVDADGWLHTSDTGYLDAAGYLFIGTRHDDVIIRGGENIDPAEIEWALCEHPAVREAAVVGVPDLEWGEAVGALVVTDEPVDAGILQAWTRQRLAGYKVPASIGFVEELPRNDMGKVVRRFAKRRLAEVA